MSELRLNTLTDKDTDKSVNVDALHYQNTQLVRNLGAWQPGLVFENKTDYATYNDQAVITSEDTTLPYTTQGYNPTNGPDEWLVIPFSEVARGDAVLNVASISELLNVQPTGGGFKVNVTAYHDGWAAVNEVPKGGGVFVWYSSRPKSDHTGGTVIDPTAPYPTVWNDKTQQAAWFNSSNSGLGCWVRQVANSGGNSVVDFGAVGDLVTDDTQAIQQADANSSEYTFLPPLKYRVTEGLKLKNRLKGNGKYLSGFPEIRMQSTTPKVIISPKDGDRLKGVEGVAILGWSEGERLHTAIRGRSYRCEFTDVSVRDVDIGLDIAGVYIWNRRLSISRARIAYYPSTLDRESPDFGSTMHRFTDCVLNYNTYGFLCENRYGGGGNSEDLFNVYMEGCGFEQNDYGLSATQRIWNLTLENTWFEACSQYGLHITSASTSVTEIDCRHESNAPRLVESDKSTIINSGEVSCKNLRVSGFITPVSDSKTAPTLVGDGTITAHIRPNTDADSSTEVVRFGAGGYAAGTETVRLLLNPNSGNKNYANGGYIEAYKPAATSDGGSYLKFGMNVRNDGGAYKRNGVIINSAGNIGFKTDNVSLPHSINFGDHSAPEVDNSYSSGRPSYRYSDIYSANGVTTTSDKREKEQQRKLSEAEVRVAKALRGQLKAFKWKNAVERKGSSARWHFGVIAQEVVDCFASEGLDAHEYGMLCYDEWDTQFDEDGNVISGAGDRYGVRYDELLAFVVSAI